MIRKKEITAEELMAQLRQDPEFCAREKLEDEEIERYNQETRIEQKQLLTELREVGVVVDDVWDLVNTRAEYPAAIPVLVRHLPKSYTLGVREGIARALTVEYAGPEVLRKLVDEFLKHTDSESELKWVLGNAIATVATPSDEEALIGLAMDRVHGRGRDRIIAALRRVVKDKARVKRILAQLAADGGV
ncbi:MAG: hypothetical protein V7608_2588 [Hyphomicrobiales bacterium]|jgi:hypothetical protein